MEKKRILRICHKLLRDNDGYDLDIQDLCLSLSDYYNNYIIFFITKKNIDEFIKVNKVINKNGLYYSKKIKSYILPVYYEKITGEPLSDFYKLKNILSFYKQYKDYFSKINPDIIHIHGTLIPQYLLSTFNKKIKIITHHIGKINLNNQELRYKLIKWIMHNSIPWFTNKVICVSEYSRSSFLFKKNIEVVVPVPKEKNTLYKNFNSLLNQNILKNKFNIKGKIYFYPARFCEQKNQLKLVQGFEKFVEDGNIDSKLILVGNSFDTVYLDKILNIIKESKFIDNYCITDEISNQEIISIIDKINFLVMPSINEGLGRIVFEALQKKKPVIISREGGFSDLLVNNSAIFINPRDIEDIQQGLKKVRFLKVKDLNLNHDEYIKKIRGIYENR